MGRQTPIIATIEDERHLLCFLRTTADIAISETFAPSPEQLWVPEFSSCKTGHWTYLLWNRTFPWSPTYATVGQQAYVSSRVGWSYISNSSAAPVLELSRSGAPSREAGRLYWANAIPDPQRAEYDISAFNRWYSCVIRWIRKHGVRHLELPLQPYLLPEAERLHRAGTA